MSAVLKSQFAERPDASVLICSSAVHADAARKQLADAKSQSIVAHLSDDLSVVSGRKVVLLLPMKVEPGSSLVKSLADKGAIAIKTACMPEVTPEGFDPIRFVKENSETVWSRPEVAAAAPAQVEAPVDAEPAPAQVPVPSAEPAAELDADADLEAANEGAWKAAQEDANGVVWEPPAEPAPVHAPRPGNIDFGGLMEPVARILRGEPTSQPSPTELRFGTHGSLSVDLEKDSWYDYESKEGGGVLAFLKHEGEVRDLAQGVNWLREHGLTAAPVQAPAPKPRGSFNVVATYPYLDAEGELLSEVLRTDPKGFRQRRPDPNARGGWTWSVKGVAQVPYRLPQMLAAPDAIVFVPEGEKDVDNLAARGLTASCNAGGACKWHDALTPHFAGRQVVLLEDNDKAGRDHVLMVASKLQGVAASVRILKLRGLAEKGDVSDWIAAGGTAEQLMQMASEAPLVPAAAPAAAEETGGNGNSREVAPAATPSSPVERRTITIIAGEISRVCDEAEAALKAARDQLYQRGGQIVRPTLSVVDASDGTKAKIVQIHPLNKHALVEEFSLAAEWQKWDARATDYVPVNPPLNIAETLMARGRSTLRRLTAVIEAPTLRRDGSILEAPGYDEATGLLLIPSEQFPPVPLAPSHDEAIAASEHLMRLVKHYPFVSPESQSVWLAGVLTAVVRRSLPTAPAFTFSATAAGSGKSALVDLISIIGFGSRAPVMSQGGDEAETEKRLHGKLLAANGIISIDNATQPIDGDALCQMLTQPTLSVRPLGSSTIVHVPTSMVVCATGNNLVIAGDMTRRALLCQLDANDERPELRQFDFDPLEVAEAGRAQYLIAALTILRAFSCAGMPQQAPKLGSFERWSELVRDAVLWLGMADPVSTMERARKADPKLECLRNVMEQWKVVFKGDSKKVREIIDVAAKEAFPPNGSRYEHPDLREALLVAAGSNGAINGAKLGHYLQGVSGRIVKGFRFIKSGEYQGTGLWKLDRVEGAGRVEDEGPPL